MLKYGPSIGDERMRTHLLDLLAAERAGAGATYASLQRRFADDVRRRSCRPPADDIRSRRTGLTGPASPGRAWELPSPSARVRRNLVRPNVAIVPIRQDSPVGSNVVRIFADKSDRRRAALLGRAAVQHPALAEAGRARRSTSTRSRPASTSSSRTSPASRSSSAGAASACSRSAAASARTRSTSPAPAPTSRPSTSRASRCAIAEQRAEVMGVADRIRFVRGERRGALVGARRRAVRPRLLVRRDPPHAAPRAEPRADARASPRPAATLKLMVYHRRSWKVFWILVKQEHGRFWNADERIAKHAEAQLGCPVAFTYTRREGRELVERAGFRVRRCVSITCSRTASATTWSTAT